MTIHKFETGNVNEALKKVNYVNYGLGGAVFTNDINKGHRFSQAWKTGMVWVNTWGKIDRRAPFGGVKQSGIGRQHGKYSLDFYSHSKNICIQLGSKL